jgi:hypothetical protein
LGLAVLSFRFALTCFRAGVAIAEQNYRITLKANAKRLGKKRSKRRKSAAQKVFIIGRQKWPNGLWKMTRLRQGHHQLLAIADVSRAIDV